MMGTAYPQWYSHVGAFLSLINKEKAGLPTIARDGLEYIFELFNADREEGDTFEIALSFALLLL